MPTLTIFKHTKTLGNVTFISIFVEGLEYFKSDVILNVLSRNLKSVHVKSLIFIKTICASEGEKQKTVYKRTYS